MSADQQVTNPVLQLEQVSFGYNSELVLHNASLTIPAREFVWIVGPNGGGKTTLVKLILGLLRPKQGRVIVLGRTPQAARGRVGYMPQQAQLDPQFPLSVLEVALMGRLGAGTGIGPYRHEDREIAMQVLAQVGLEDQAKRTLKELSGGQRRRLLIARALVAQPEMLVLDEPTANLDRAVERDLFELLQRLNEKLTVILVSHDPAFVSDFVKRVVCVNRHVSIHPTAALEGDLMDELYGRQMRLVRHDRHQEGPEETCGG